MRIARFLISASAAVLVAATLVEAKHGAHSALEALHRRHRQNREAQKQNVTETIEERGLLTCAFPNDAGLVAVTPGLLNGGWAIAPDQACTASRHCPYACPPGQVSMQWDPDSKTYSFPGSRNGGLYCGLDGKVTKPFPDRPYCQPTAQNIGVQNKCSGVVSFCQTVLPGDEDMLIPTAVTDYASLAVPDPNYWASTAAHYYINPPGVSVAEACVWGSSVKPVGNWSPYVAGANSDSSGQTFIKLGWNPIYLEPTTPFRNEIPDWGVKIECPNGGCNGLPCAIDPSKNGVNEMIGSSSGGAGGASFCVVTVQKGSQANFVVFRNGEETSNKPGQFYESSATTSTTSQTTTTTTKLTATSSTTTTTQTISTTKSKSPNTNSTTSSYTREPTGHYYALFNTTVPSTTNEVFAEPTSASPTTTESQPGAGTTKSISQALVLLALALLMV